MIDKARFPVRTFNILKPQLFIDKKGNHPEPINTLDGNIPHDGNMFYRQFNFQKDLVETKFGIKPSLTLKDRPNTWYRYELTIELSPQKVLYGNNLQEPDDSQFNETVTAIQELLMSCGVEVPFEVLASATGFSRLDFAHNIELKHLTVDEFIRFSKS